MAFNYEKRKLLEECMQKRVGISRVAVALGVSRQTVYTELLNGLEGDAAVLRDYSQYSADLAQETIKRRLLEKVE